MNKRSDEFNNVRPEKRPHPNDPIPSKVNIRQDQQDSQLLSDQDQTRSDRQPQNRHTVSIRSDLSKIPPSYAIELPKDLPSDSFWVNVVQRANENDIRERAAGLRSQTTPTAQYKLLYSKANGPCKL